MLDSLFSIIYSIPYLIIGLILALVLDYKCRKSSPPHSLTFLEIWGCIIGWPIIACFALIVLLSKSDA